MVPRNSVCGSFGWRAWTRRWLCLYWRFVRTVYTCVRFYAFLFSPPSIWCWSCFNPLPKILPSMSSRVPHFGNVRLGQVPFHDPIGQPGHNILLVSMICTICCTPAVGHFVSGWNLYDTALAHVDALLEWSVCYKSCTVCINGKYRIPGMHYLDHNLSCLSVSYSIVN